jgi:hypothetical protein
MHVKDNDAVTNYLTALTTGGQVASVVYDRGLGTHDRFTLIQTLPDGKYFGVFIKDSINENDNTFKGELVLDTSQ